MSPKVKSYIASSAVTFISTFLTTLGTIMAANPAAVFTTQGFSAAGFFSLVAVAVRAGVKALMPDYSVSAIAGANK